MDAVRVIIYLIAGYWMGVCSVCLICRRWDD